MNRNISTLFTAGLLMAGSLCGSAWAQSSIQQLAGFVNGQGTFTATPATELKAGHQYVFVNDQTNNEAYGHELSGSTITESTIGLSTPLADNDDVKQYVWTVGITESPKGFFSYNFTNVETGKLLRVNVGFTAIEKNTKVEDKNTNKDFVFDGSSVSALTGGAYSGTNNNLYIYSSSTPLNGLNWGSNVSTVSTTIAAPIFYEVKSELLTNSEELNALYNTSGFSFVSKRLKDQGEEPIGNLFNDKMVVARYLARPITIDATQYPGYSGSSSDLQIPAGMYFFTKNAPALDNSDQVVRDYNAWLNATVLVASSTETMEGTNAGRANGDGFSLVEKEIGDLNLYVGTGAAWKTQGDEISIHNACFRVQKSYVESYPYELNLDRFRFRIQGSKADHKDAQIKLEILQHNDNFYLTTISNTSDKTDKFIFKLGVAGTKKGIELLNKEAKAAVYTIRVLSGKQGDVKSVYGKYLTSAVDNGSFELVAKAKVLSQTETPAYQWMITSVDDTYKITFTNRETGDHFLTTLFPKTDLGENVYETAVPSTRDITPIYVDENTYRETASTQTVEFKRLLVELTKVEEVDPYAGFLNVDDQTLVTMAFARDNNVTSNKWYTAVTKDNNSNVYKLNADGKFANSVSDAAQWQLIKDEAPKTIIESSFVYNRGNHVTVQAKGDKGYAYAYQLRYINDGIETNAYFPQGTGTSTHVNGADVMAAADAAKFVIKQAADGSVYLIPVSSTNANVTTVFGKTTKSVVAVKYNNDEYVYTTPSVVYALPGNNQDMTLKTYLIEEAPEISYPAKNGHISLVSELGNYISLNENQEGIVVNNEQYSFYLRVTDTKAIVPSFYISKGTEDPNRSLFLFNPKDSVDYYVAEGMYDKKYEWAEKATKAIFKSASIEANNDTISTVVKGKEVKVAKNADDEGVLGGLDNFKVQIIQCADDEGMYVIRSVKEKGRYLYGLNDKLAWGTDKNSAMKFTITAGDPTSNESVADGAAGVKVIGGNGIVEIQGAAGKKVVISNILGKVVAETILASDNATIAVPAGIIAVAVEGENAVKTIVK